MQDQRGRTSFIRHGSLSVLAGVLTIIAAALTPSFTENAVANGETRTLYLYHAHTHEQIAATYLVSGQYDQAVLKQLNWFLRDWRRDEPTNMDPRLFDVVWEAYRQAGADEPINVVSAYRSPETNAMLRRRSRAVAKYSQHMLGKAMDTTMPGMSMSRIREIGMRMQRGGVGYYPTAGTPFVHLDVGSVRSWPRMSYDQLVRLFPDGKTVHLPTNNQPLARYDEARAEIEAHGGAYAPVERKSKSFLAFLFGGGDEDEDSGVVAPPPSNARKQWASLAPRGSRSAGVAADAEEEGAAAAPAERPGRRKGSAARLERIAEAERNLPRGETTLTPAAEARNAPAERRGEGERLALLAPAAPEPAANDDSPPEKIAVEPPLPPRRPANLLALDAPLPPARPIELASLADAVAVFSAPRSVGLPAPASAVALDVRRSRAGAAIAGLIDVTGATPLTSPAEAGLRGSTSTEPNKPRPEPLLAYAPAASQPNAAPPAPPASPRLPTATRPPTAKPAVLRADILPARLDRSNFRAMTATAPTSRMAAGSVLGSTISAPRSAARAEPNLFAARPENSYISAFAPKADVLPTDRFVAVR